MRIKIRRAIPALISASTTVITCNVFPRPGSSAKIPPPAWIALKSHSTPSTWCGLSTCARAVQTVVSKLDAPEPPSLPDVSACAGSRLRQRQRRRREIMGEGDAMRGSAQAHLPEGRADARALSPRLERVPLLGD